MSDMGGEQSPELFDDDEDFGVEPISMPNAMEEAANRYWRASRVWRNQDEASWNFGNIIAECRGILCYRGRVAYLVEGLLDDVVHDRRQEYQASNDAVVTQHFGQ